MSTTATPPLVLDAHESSAWLRQASSERLATIPRIPGVTIVAPLGNPSQTGEREDRTCDRCRTYVRPRCRNFFPAALWFSTPDGDAVVLTLGLCRTCALAEAPEAGDL